MFGNSGVPSQMSHSHILVRLLNHNGNFAEVLITMSSSAQCFEH